MIACQNVMKHIYTHLCCQFFSFIAQSIIKVSTFSIYKCSIEEQDFARDKKNNEHFICTCVCVCVNIEQIDSRVCRLPSLNFEVEQQS